MSKKQYEYQVSGVTDSPKKYFSNFEDAQKYAMPLSRKQVAPVYIDISETKSDVLLPHWYTVTQGKLKRHEMKRVQEVA